MNTDYGSIGRGLGEWRLQRASALYMGLYLAGIGVVFVMDPVEGYRDWLTTIGWMPLRVATVLFFAAVLVHGWIGLRSVVLDYVHGAWLRGAVLLAAAILFCAQAVWTLLILLAPGLGP